VVLEEVSTLYTPGETSPCSTSALVTTCHVRGELDFVSLLPSVMLAGTNTMHGGSRTPDLAAESFTSHSLSDAAEAGGNRCRCCYWFPFCSTGVQMPVQPLHDYSNLSARWGCGSRYQCRYQCGYQCRCQCRCQCGCQCRCQCKGIVQVPSASADANYKLPDYECQCRCWVQMPRLPVIS
jgi:hypothetical protein